MKKTLLLVLFLYTVSSLAQEKKEPTVGLVLSGGGAKGLAHIGALKIIEESNVKIDYIGGTSMGAIVGALYAAGYSANQLDSIFQGTNFNMLIQDNVPRRAKTFYEKEYDERYVLTLPFNDFSISFPSGLSRGQNLYNMISRLTHHLEGEQDFSNFPIPFFCVAADIETGEEVILDSGSLPQAVSASAAIPTVFSPVLMGDRLYTDGGVVNNYPVEELRKRGAGIVIGVDVQDSLRGREELKSVFDVLTQISNFNTVQNMKEKSGQTDVYIVPPINPYNVMSFDRGRRIIDIGAEAAEKHRAELEEIAAMQKQETKDPVKIPRVDSIHIADVMIEGNTTYPREYIMGKLHLKYPFKISYEELNLGINNLSATGNFNRVNHKLVPINGSFVLVLQLEENQNKTLLRLGIHYDDFYKSAALVNLTQKSLLFTNDITSFDLVLGDNFRYYLDYFWDKGYFWSMGLKSSYSGFEKNVDVSYADNHFDIDEVNINRIALDYSDFTNQLYFETVFEKRFSVGVGAEHKYLKVSSETVGEVDGSQVPSTIFDNSSYYSAFGSLKADTYDNKYFPRKGFYFKGDFHVYLFSSDYSGDFSEFSITKGSLGYALTPVTGVTARFSGAGGFRIGSNDNNAFNFFLGGYGNDFINNIVPFYGYDFLDLSADSFVKGMVEVDYEIFRKNHIIASANMGSVEDDLFSHGNFFSTPDFSGYALGYGIETFVGPIEIKYSYSPESKRSYWFFNLGFWF